VSRPKIFIVDDESVIAFTLAAILAKHGMQASAFTSAEAALEAAAAGGQDGPDLLISDVMMPGMNGVELGVQFRLKYPECKVLLFSGQAQTRSLLKEARAEGHDFTLLAKPIHPKDLLAAIGALEK
jgi:DNA-binding NtrC family response regulator